MLRRRDGRDGISGPAALVRLRALERHGGQLHVAIGEAVFQGWFLTFVAFLAYMKLVHRLGPPTAALGIATVPPMGVVIATLLLHETAHPGQWVGRGDRRPGLAISSGAGFDTLRRVAGLRPVPDFTSSRRTSPVQCA